MTSDWHLSRIDADSWWPDRYIPQSQTWFGGLRTSLVRLGEIASVFIGGAHCPANTPFVTPGDVDPRSGELSPSSLSDGRLAMRLGDELKQGDVLVPRQGSGLAVLVNDAMRNVSFGGFLVVRATGQVPGELLWGLLSSRSGESARYAATADSTLPVLSIEKLADLQLPVPPLFATERVRSLLPADPIPRPVRQQLESHWCVRALTPGSSWWQTTDANETDLEGTALNALGTPWAGTAQLRDCFGHQGDNRLPLLTRRLLRGAESTPSLWIDSAGQRSTTDSTVVVMATEPFRAYLAPAGYALAKGLLAVDIGERQEAPRELIAAAVAKYLSTIEGRERLRSCAGGVTIAHLTLAALGNTSVSLPNALSLLTSEQAKTVHLADRLERALEEASEP